MLPWKKSWKYECSSGYFVHSETTQIIYNYIYIVSNLVKFAWNCCRNKNTKYVICVSSQPEFFVKLQNSILPEYLWFICPNQLNFPKKIGEGARPVHLCMAGENVSFQCLIRERSYDGRVSLGLIQTHPVIIPCGRKLEFRRNSRLSVWVTCW